MSRFDDDALDRLQRGVWFTIPRYAWLRFAAQWGVSIGVAAALYGVPFGPALYVMSGPGPDPGPEPEPEDDAFYDLETTEEPEREPERVAVAEPPPPPEVTPLPIRRIRVSRPTPTADPVPLPELPEAPPAELIADEPEAEEEPEEPAERPRRRPNRPPKKPRPNKAEPKAPCEPAEGIEVLGENRWLVKRELVEFYATHPFQLDQLASVWTHEDAAGEPDGFKLGLPRCTVLRSAGFRSADVVNDVNGRVISTIPQAIGAYFMLRREEVYYLHISRKDPKTKAIVHLELVYEIEESDRKRRRRERAEEEALDLATPIEPAPVEIDDGQRPKRRRQAP